MSPALRMPRASILLEDLAVDLDIGFHDFEVGSPQRVFLTIEVELDRLPGDDDPEGAWDYDRLRTDVLALARTRRWNLQETLAREIWELVVARPGTGRVRVATRKPDIYADARAVGVDLVS